MWANPNVRYFHTSIAVTAFGLIAALFIGGPAALVLTLILAAAEISLSFDNAVVNATVLENMEEKWKRWFMTWGILIAVFGMRLVFPVAIIAIVADLGPIEAIKLSLFDHEAYAHHLHSAHVPVAAFGGTFLLLVALEYFFDAEKDKHWLTPVEKLLHYAGRHHALSPYVATLLAVGGTVLALYDAGKSEYVQTFVTAAGASLLTFFAVAKLKEYLEEYEASRQAAGIIVKGGVGAVIYLEILDASFSFDGVIAATAITNHILIIMIGLGVGAMFVRSLTIMLVEKGTLTEYEYLENGAFFGILALATIMFIKLFTEVPELVTGLISVGFILAALWSSIQKNRLTA